MRQREHLLGYADGVDRTLHPIQARDRVSIAAGNAVVAPRVAGGTI